MTLSPGERSLNIGPKVNDEEFIKLRDFIYAQCGIFIAENRKYLIENRFASRLKALNLKSYGEYYNYLRFDIKRKEELTLLFDIVTTNETSFFRNTPQLEVFRDVVLKGVVDEAIKNGRKKLRIWSAGCSTGEEPYTVAIILHEYLGPQIKLWDIKITANDLSESVVAEAKKGRYSEYALRSTPQDLVKRYFTKEDGKYCVSKEVKSIVTLETLNLKDKLSVDKVERSQIIFCRNVIIYFDEEMKRQVISTYYDNLLPGGSLIIGHSESLHSISKAFKPEHHKGTIIYRKQS